MDNFDKYKNLNKLSDEELVQKALSDKTDKDPLNILSVRYMGVIKRYAKKYSPKSPETAEDLVQEGYIGFLNAVKTFEKSKGVAFGAYSSLCIKSKILSSIKKNMPQGDGISFEEELENVKDTDYIPEDVVIDRETENELFDRMFSTLSDFEKEVFSLFLKGMSYNEIAEKLDVTPKSADNAMQRVRRKIKALLG